MQKINKIFPSYNTFLPPFTADKPALILPTASYQALKLEINLGPMNR